MQLAGKTCFRGRGKILGITVLELMIILAAIAVIVLVAVPASTVVIDKYRMKVASASIVTALELAQSEASARSSMVVLCPSSNGHTCRNDGDWGFGWLVFSDGNGNGTVDDIELIRSFKGPSQKIHIVADGAVQNRAAFMATGLVANGNARSGVFQICLAGSKNAAAIVKVDSNGWVQKLPDRAENCQTG